MATKRLPRPRDPIQLGKLIVDIATGQLEDRIENDTPAMASGREGGKRGGPARAKVLNADRRKEIARSAAIKRWSK